MITEKIEVEDGILDNGGFSYIRRGRYMGHPVAVKNLKVTVQDDFVKIRKVSANNIFPATWDAVSIILLQQFCREVVLWNTLSHPNVLKLVGVQEDMERGQFITVSGWMAHGNIMEYIRNNCTNRLELVCDFAFPTTSFVKL